VSEVLTHYLRDPTLILAYNLAVYGLPGPQGSKRHVGNGRMVESSLKVKPWREAVKYTALNARVGALPLAGPVWMRLIFTLPKPKSAPKRRTTWPDRKPDLDKLTRSTLDALTDAGLWHDDSQVVEFLRQAKTYPNEDVEALEAPGALIQVFVQDPHDAH
jgi:crossover junction endodeoxyribonuclease RusA